MKRPDRPAPQFHPILVGTIRRELSAALATLPFDEQRAVVRQLLVDWADLNENGNSQANEELTMRVLEALPP